MKNMNTTIKHKQKWIDAYGIAGMTATDWLYQLLGFERESELSPIDVMRDLRIGGWSHSCHYKGDSRLENTNHAHAVLSDEVARLAAELDDRLNQLAAIESRLKDIYENE